MIYGFKEIDNFVSRIDEENFVRRGGVSYMNAPFAFDIETSSFYQSEKGDQRTNDEYHCLSFDEQRNYSKKAVMYVWQFAYCDDVIMGRTWEQFQVLVGKLRESLGLGNDRKIIVYVHNLSYEFQFMRKWFDWCDMFADSERKPLKCETNGVIFKDSLRLSGYSLKKVADNLHNHKIEKMVGDLDYTKIRHSQTKLTKKEIGYCVNDVLILTAYIEEQIDEYGNILKIPLTQTGKIRRLTRKKCFENKAYKNFISKMTIDKFEYVLLQNAFAGGFTHSNGMYSNSLVHGVTSYDFTSSYPTVMISEKYPMGKGRQMKIIGISQIEMLSEKYCVLFDCKIKNLKPKFIWENILSYSKCRNVENPKINNGRLVSADCLTTTLTEIDYKNLKSFYEFEVVEVGLCYVYRKDYLPKEIIETILKLYNDKTILKGVEGKEIEYMHSKELLNSLYGMCVTSIVHDTYTYRKNEWGFESADVEGDLSSYNNDINRFLFYPWGVWVTAYARNNLYTAILECGSDYVYSDTDSVKILNVDKHKDYFKKYNDMIVEKLTNCLAFYDIDKRAIKPKTIEDVEKPLGVWDLEGSYDDFKTLGAKRYMYRQGSKYATTIAGLSKSVGLDYIQSQENPFDFFNDGMLIDRHNTGKMTHTYIDDEITGVIIDYRNNVCTYNEKSYIHHEETEFCLSMTTLYIQYLIHFKEFLKNGNKKVL